MTADHLPQRPPRPLATLRAAATRITGRKIVRTSSQAWQDEAWDLYDEVGELRFSANALASALSRTKLFVGHLGAEEEEPVAIDAEEEPIIDEVFGKFGGGVLERAELIRRLAVQLFVPGDCYIVGLPPQHDLTAPASSAVSVEGLPPEGRTPEGDLDLSELDWYALSISEVKLRAGSVELLLGTGEPATFSEDDVLVIRVWRPHPRRFWEADSPVRANLPILRELVGLTKHVGASIDSRLAGAGLLLVSDTIRVSSAQSAQPDDGDGRDDDFVDALIESMLTPIRDRDNASAVVPLVATVPDDALDKIKHITFTTPFDATAMQLREEAIRRLALGLDMPPEVLLGMGGTNHWSAWQIEESTVKTHLEPVLALICDAITAEFLWPALEAAGVDNPQDYVVWFDTTPLTLRPNRAGEAQALHAVNAITDEALRRESGFDEADAPPKPDRAVEIALRMVQDSPGAMVENPAILPILVDALRTALAEGHAIEEAGADPADADPDAPPPVDDPVDTGTELPDTQGDAPDNEVSIAAALTAEKVLAGRGYEL